MDLANTGAGLSCYENDEARQLRMDRYNYHHMQDAREHELIKTINGFKRSVYKGFKRSAEMVSDKLKLLGVTSDERKNLTVSAQELFAAHMDGLEGVQMRDELSAEVALPFLKTNYSGFSLEDGTPVTSAK